MYSEYDMINYQLLQRFNIDAAELKEILKDFPEEINQEKLERNLQCLSLTKIGDTKYLKLESFADFLDKMSDVISKEVEQECR